MIYKRGGIFSLTYLIAFIFVVAVLALFFFKLSWEVTGAYKDIDGFNDTVYAKDINSRVQNMSPMVHDYLILFLFLGSVIGLMVSAVRTDFSAVVIGLFILLMIITIFISSGLVNIYQGFANAEGLSDISGKMTFTNILFSKYLPLMIMVISAFILMIMYGKTGGSIIQ